MIILEMQFPGRLTNLKSINISLQRIENTHERELLNKKLMVSRSLYTVN